MNKEDQILHYIKMNPFISQQELSARIGLSRSAVANYISTLTKRGEIKGRAYVLSEDASILCIGGANVDRKAKAHQKVQLSSSNPVEMSESCGGVARNIAENLSRLGLSTSLLSTVGDDKEGNWLLQETKGLGIDVSQVWLLSTERTGTYTALLDIDGEMVVSMADMNIYDQMTPAMFEDKWSYIASSKAIFADTNIPTECLRYLIKRCIEYNIPLYIDPVSSAKASKLPDRLDGVELILPNKEEAELLANVTIDSIEDCKEASEKIRARGVQKVVITLGEWGIYYSSAEESGHLPPFKTDIVDVTGAGDAFAASLLFGIESDEPLSTACQLGLAAATLTLQTENSVSIFLQSDTLYKMVKEFS
jgi:pseudouridine kinase